MKSDKSLIRLRTPNHSILSCNFMLRRNRKTETKKGLTVFTTILDVSVKSIVRTVLCPDDPVVPQVLEIDMGFNQSSAKP